MAPAGVLPLQETLPGESEQVAVQGSAIRGRLELRADLVGRKKPIGATENRQNFLFRHGW